MQQKILILGGTQFIGRCLVERLLQMEQYELTLFNRQKTGADLFPSLAKIKGDRETDAIRQIGETEWDYVIDLSCYYPAALEATLASLKGNLKKYVFVSTCSVYDIAGDRTVLKTEAAPVLGCTEEEAVSRLPAAYGQKKAACERMLAQSGLPMVSLRPSLVYGQYDHTDRFYYWLDQVRRHDELLLPDQGERTLSLTYVHDLVEATLQALDSPFTGNYNVITLPQVSIRDIVETTQKLLGKECTHLNATPEFLHAEKISQWTDMPIWLDGDFFTYSNQKFDRDFGLPMHELEASVLETLAYYEDIGNHQPGYGMPESKRQELIQKLKA